MGFRCDGLVLRILTSSLPPSLPLSPLHIDRSGLLIPILVSTGEPCATYRTCGTCMSDPFCGWCPSTQLCSEGNKNGPLFGKCGDWEHGAMQSGCNSDGPPQAEADGPPTGA